MSRRAVMIICVVIIIIITGLVFFDVWRGVDPDWEEHLQNWISSWHTKKPADDTENQISQEIIDYTERLPAPVQLEGTKKYKDLVISNIIFEMTSLRECEIRAIAENRTNNVIEMQDIKITVYDSNNEVLNVVGAQIDSVEPGKAVEMSTLYRTKEIANVARIEIEEN